jgi:uncharacterized membrane protein YccF (DUF307 family)
VLSELLSTEFAGAQDLQLQLVSPGVLNTVAAREHYLQAFKLAGFALWPFGRTAVARPGASAARSGCGNVLWFILGGWYMALIHFITALLLCIFIITFPFAIQDFKLAGLALAPFGKEIVSNAEAQRRRAYYAAGAATGWQGPSAMPSGPPALPPAPTQNDIAF